MTETPKADEGDEGSAAGQAKAKRSRQFAKGTLLVVLLVVLASTALIQTRSGQDLVLREIVGLVSGSLAGELRIESIHSGTLLTGATLSGVTLTAEGGRRFLTADSMSLSYSLSGLFLGRPTIRRVVVHGLDAEISTYLGEERPNVSRLIRAPVPGAEAKPRAPILIRRLGVRDGRIDVLSPAPTGYTGTTVEAPDGSGRLRRIGFDGVDLDLEEAIIRPGDAARILEAHLASLTTDVTVFEDPLVIDEAQAEITFGAAGIILTDAAFRLPSTLVRGELSLGPPQPGEDWALDSRLTTDGDGQLIDLAWLDARIPEGTFSGGARLQVGGDGVAVELHDVHIDLEATSVIAQGGAGFRNGRLWLEAMRITASPLVLDRLEPWVGRQMMDGWLSGQITLSGTLTDLRASGRVTVVPRRGFGGGATTADFRGTIHSGPNPGATGLEVRLNPLNYEMLRLIAPTLDVLGTGQGTFEATGRVQDGLRFSSDMLYQPQGQPSSRAHAGGTVFRREGGEWAVDVSGDLAPLSVVALERLLPDADLRGELTGPVQAVGPLSDLRVTGDFQAGAGRIGLDAWLDVNRPGAKYRVDLKADRVLLSQYFGKLQDPSEWTGSLSVDGRGLRPDSMEATGTVSATGSRLGGLHVDTLTADVHVAAGVLVVDTVIGTVGGIRIVGRGGLGLTENHGGEMALDFQTSSLIGLRPLLLGDSVIARDTLSVLESELLRAQGIDLAGLPDTADVRMSGRLQGHAQLTGSFRSLNVDLDFRLTDGVYGPNRIDTADVRLEAIGLPSTAGEWGLALDAAGIQWEGQAFQTAHIEGDMSGREGFASVALERGTGDRYDATGRFEIDSLGGTVHLDRATASLDSLSWTLTHAATVSWDSVSVSVVDMELARPGADPMRITASGTLSRRDDSSFRLQVEGLHLEKVTRAAQLESLDIGGHVDLDLTVEGSAGDPRISGIFRVLEPRFRDIALTRIEGDLQYSARSADLHLDAWDRQRAVFNASGTVPIDMALTNVPDRLLDEPMDIHVQADSLSAQVALAYLTTLDDVEGTVSGEFDIRGTAKSPEPSGVVRLRDGAWSLEALGVRHAGVEGELTLTPDRMVEVQLTASTGGSSEVTGTVELDPLGNPRLNLAVSFQGFQALQRRDMEGRISGDITVTGSYRRPVVGGDLSVDQGTLFLDEFARSASVVDLADPRLFQMAIDTTFLVGQPILAGIRNPFMQNLRVDIDLSVPRDTWLRSNDMNVEIGGDLDVRYDRQQGELVLVGSLEALRGSYTALGRPFTVTGGTVGFPGTAGVNPVLDIQAVGRIRRRIGEEPLEINATVSGTLVGPRLDLSSSEAGLTQSDLFSYLMFGRSTAELSTGEEALISGAAGSFAGAAIEGGITMLSGALATRFSAALAQGIGLDYLSISQAGDFGVLSGNLGSSFAGTQVEIGQYIGEKAFVVLLFRPLSNQSSAGGGSKFGGAKIEWALTDNFVVEGFLEDRFQRTRPGFGDLIGQPSRILGVFIFREFGYTR